MEVLDKILKTKETDKKIFLLWGEEAFLRSHYRKRLTELFYPSVMPELNMFTFEGKDCDINAIDSAIESLPVMDETKLLVFSDSLIFKTDSKTGASAEIREYWQKRIKDIPDYVRIIFSEAEIDKRSALYKTLLKNGSAFEFSYLTEEKLKRWTVGLFKNFGKTILPGDAAYLVGICPEGMMSIKREAEKLCAYKLEDDAVTREDIDNLVAPRLNDRVFDMVSAMLNKKTEPALMILSDLFLLKTEPAQIMGAIIYNIDKLIFVKLLKSEGRDNREIASKLKIAPFQMTKFSETCGKYTKEQLYELSGRAAQTDLLLKSNSMDKNVVLQLFVTETAEKSK